MDKDGKSVFAVLNNNLPKILIGSITSLVSPNILFVSVLT